jgi:putative ubiquitin-RnfH superfamily antitoxin RatB of RatAB toxin-antitoxin module
MTDTIAVSVVWSPEPSLVREHALQFPCGTTVGQVIATLPNAPLCDDTPIGIWGRLVALDSSLQDGDRIELYRPLKVDPKVARRERFKTQGRRSAGLFAKKPHPLQAPKQPKA